MLFRSGGFNRPPALCRWESLCRVRSIPHIRSAVTAKADDAYENTHGSLEATLALASWHRLRSGGGFTRPPALCPWESLCRVRSIPHIRSAVTAKADDAYENSHGSLEATLALARVDLRPDLNRCQRLCRVRRARHSLGCNSKG